WLRHSALTSSRSVGQIIGMSGSKGSAQISLRVLVPRPISQVSSFKMRLSITTVTFLQYQPCSRARIPTLWWMVQLRSGLIYIGPRLSSWVEDFRWERCTKNSSSELGSAGSISRHLFMKGPGDPLACEGLSWADI